MARTKKSSSKGKISLVNVAPINQGVRDRAGGDTHGRVLNAISGWFVREIPQDELRKNLDAALEQLQGTLSSLTARTMKDWDLESISVSLAVSAEGSIGVATVGTEASIEATFARKKAQV